MLLYFLKTDIPYNGVSHLLDVNEGHIYPDFENIFFPPDDTLFTFTLAPNEKKFKNFLTTASLTTYGMVISNQVKDILSRFKLPEHKFYPIKIITPSKEEITDYSFLRMRRVNIENIVDYKQSVFYLGRYGSKQEIIQIGDYESFVKKKGQLKEPFKIISEELIISSEINFDIFQLERPLGRINYYMTESLRKELKKARINGFKAIQANYRSDENDRILSPVLRSL